jgi:hypothetical protein
MMGSSSVRSEEVACDCEVGFGGPPVLPELLLDLKGMDSCRFVDLGSLLRSMLVVVMMCDAALQGQISCLAKWHDDLGTPQVLSPASPINPPRNRQHFANDSVQIRLTL